MIALLSSNLLMLPDPSSVSRARDYRRVAHFQPSGDRVAQSKELDRWIGRWENEGGAILRESGGDNSRL
jgi:hypothetical protein